MSTPWRAMALALVATLLASGSVSANKYPCEEPELPPFRYRHPSLAHSFGPTGTWWFPVAGQPGDAPRCEWSSESDERVAGVFEALPARPDLLGTKTWVRVSSERPLDPMQRWRLECDWNFVACVSGSCPTSWSTQFAPILPLPDSDANISLQVEDRAIESWYHELQRADLLRLWIDTVPPEFWMGYGVLRVRYPDGRWSLAVPASGGWPTELSLLPGLEAGERSLRLELVDGKNHVLAVETIEIGDDLITLDHLRCGPTGCRN